MTSMWTALFLEALVLFAVAGVATNLLRNRLRTESDGSAGPEAPVMAEVSGA